MTHYIYDRTNLCLTSISALSRISGNRNTSTVKISAVELSRFMRYTVTDDWKDSRSLAILTYLLKLILPIYIIVNFNKIPIISMRWMFS